MEINKLDGELDILISYTAEPTITLRGEVDFRNMERVREAICSLAERGQASINVDLKELVFMDSTGVSALVDAARSIVPKGAEVRLVSPSAQLVKMLNNSGFSAIFKCPETGGSASTVACPVKREIQDVVEFEAPSKPEMISYIRAKVTEFACSMPFNPDEIDDIRLAVGEASSNAMRHGSNPEWNYIGVRMERHADCIRIFISDKGRGFNPDAVRAPAVGDLIEGGRGILFMRSIMDEVKFHFTNPGTQVELVKNVMMS